MSPQLRLICAQGRDYTYIYIKQVCLHRNIAAPSLAADCNVPQRPPAAIWSFTSMQMVHTHTPRNSGADEMTMKVKWKWKWNESYLTRTRRGERKRRGKEQTPTQTHLAQNGQTLKRQGKKKRRPTETEPDQRRRGRTEAPEPTYHGET